MERRPTVLVSGASIAGPALAYWLDRHGWTPTLLERAGSVRTEGQNIDVRGAGREVARPGPVTATTPPPSSRSCGVSWPDCWSV